MTRCVAAVLSGLGWPGGLVRIGTAQGRRVGTSDETRLARRRARERCRHVAKRLRFATMAARKQFQTNLTVAPELSRLLGEARGKDVSEAELREQRISFAYGNAPPSEHITKDSVRFASERVRLKD